MLRIYFNSLPLRIGNKSSRTHEKENNNFNSLPLRIGNYFTYITGKCAKLFNSLPLRIGNLNKAIPQFLYVPSIASL